MLALFLGLMLSVDKETVERYDFLVAWLHWGYTQQEHCSISAHGNLELATDGTKDILKVCRALFALKVQPLPSTHGYLHSRHRVRPTVGKVVRANYRPYCSLQNAGKYQTASPLP
jgi:hypothetical protein